MDEDRIGDGDELLTVPGVLELERMLSQERYENKLRAAREKALIDESEELRTVHYQQREEIILLQVD